MLQIKPNNYDMRLNFSKYLFVFVFSFLSICSFSQRQEMSTWKAQIALGINYPDRDGFVEDAFAKSINFPTVNLGVQRMFSRQLGAKLDYGFNRFSNDDDESPEFKVNYSRINVQLVYDPTTSLYFLPEQVRTVLHAGPGFSFAKPLGTLGDNKQSYLNFNLGLELHYTLSRKVSIYTDVSYIYGFTKRDDFNPPITGLGAFNGNVLNVTFGVSISLSGCYYCN
jgi:hypothetical protein